MQRVRQISELREILASRKPGHRLGLVPTMGNLHRGHLQLVAASTQSCDVTVTSIFVNPLQFGAGEDLDSYPRTLEEDEQQLRDAGVDIVFAPQDSEIYPDGRAGQTVVSVPELSDQLCGASRPGHFDGVTTVVLKLFNIVRPDIAFFGRKDYQQLTIIRAMSRHLNVAVEISGIDTVRAPDGLALSSRNAYLEPGERAAAPALYEALQATGRALQEGSSDYRELESKAQANLCDAGFVPDYVAIRDADTLAPARPESGSLVVLAAGQLGRTRLIDNLTVSR